MSYILKYSYTSYTSCYVSASISTAERVRPEDIEDGAKDQRKKHQKEFGTPLAQR